jgi:trehalose 6-phosphate phosphatase
LTLLDGASLFLDLDGTLFELVDDPAAVKADASLRALVSKLAVRFEGRLAVISGRSIAQIDAMLGDCAADLAVSGSHGCEHRWRGLLARPDRPQTLDRAAARARAFAEAEPGLLVEEKSYGVALHYRAHPSAELRVQALARALADEFGLVVQPGKMVSELRIAGGGKGSAVRRLMRGAPMKGTVPVFIGDDVTDEPGFEAATALGGSGILVGPARPTAARYRLDSPADLRAWLAEAQP